MRVSTDRSTLRIGASPPHASVDYGRLRTRNIVPAPSLFCLPSHTSPRVAVGWKIGPDFAFLIEGAVGLAGTAYFGLRGGKRT